MLRLAEASSFLWFRSISGGAVSGGGAAGGIFEKAAEGIDGIEIQFVGHMGHTGGSTISTTTVLPTNPGGTEDIMSIPADAFPNRSDHILYVRKVGQITGQAGFTDTYEKFNVFGTDLGIPYYDETTGRLTLLFGDTYAAANFSGNWRSNVALYTTQTEYHNGIAFTGGLTIRKGDQGFVIGSLCVCLRECRK